MILNYLIINDGNNDYKYNFVKNSNIIYSSDNSKGKTTLIRFLLHALGYQIPPTEGISDFDKFRTEISIDNGGKNFVIIREKNQIIVSGDDNIHKEFLLPTQENDLHSLIFGINEIIVLNNLLAVYYIDQEKGWTMLNRGKIIGNNRFSIEEFVAGISEIDISDLINEKNAICTELKKYRYFKNVIDIRDEYQDVDSLNSFENENLSDLLEMQKQLEIELSKTIKLRKTIENVLAGNKDFSDLLTSLNVVIKHNDEQFVLTSDNLVDFDSYQTILKTRINTLKLDEQKIKQDLSKITFEINTKNTLFSVESIVEGLEKTIESWGIDVSSVDNVITQLNNKRNKINSEIKQKLSFNNNMLLGFYNIVYKYAQELGIADYIKEKSPKFILTNKLKGFSGRVLVQMSFIFKLSYIKTVYDKYGLLLPIIIDSPRTSELSEKSTNDMLNILKRDYSSHQIIIASIYENSILSDRIINLDNKLFSKNYIINNTSI